MGAVQFVIASPTARLHAPVVSQHAADLFIFLQPTGAQTGEDAGPPQVIVVQNWHEELKRLVPVD